MDHTTRRLYGQYSTRWRCQLPNVKKTRGHGDKKGGPKAAPSPPRNADDHVAVALRAWRAAGRSRAAQARSGARPLRGPIVLGPFLLSLGLRLRLRSNLPAANEESHFCGAANPRVGVAPPPASAHPINLDLQINLDRWRDNVRSNNATAFSRGPI
jgi:hypothetical protein